MRRENGRRPRADSRAAPLHFSRPCLCPPLLPSPPPVAQVDSLEEKVSNFESLLKLVQSYAEQQSASAERNTGLTVKRLERLEEELERSRKVL